MIRSIACISLLLIVYHSHAQTLTDRIRKAENSLMTDIQLQDSSLIKFSLKERMLFYGVNAVSIAIVNNGKIEWAKAYGYADTARKIKATTNTLFAAASISKSVNAFGIMRLVSQGRLSLDKDVRQYLKSWKIPENNFSRGRQITIKALLSHSAGFSNPGMGNYTWKDTIPTTTQILRGRAPAHSKPAAITASPEKSYNYSGQGVMVTQQVLEDQINPNYPLLMNDLVFLPLGMKNSTFRVPLRFNDVALGYNGVGEIHYRDLITPFSAAGGLWSTPSDLARFIIAVQDARAGKTPNVLDQKTAAKMLTPSLDTATYKLSYGNAMLAPGFFLMDRDGEQYFFHSGGTEGFSSLYYATLDGNMGAVVMVNSNNTQLLFEIMNSIATVYGWKNFYQPEMRQLINLPDTLAEQYVGVYEIADIKAKFRIQQIGNGFQMASKIGDGAWVEGGEQIYFISEEEFFVFSNKLRYKFKRDAPNRPFTLYIQTDDGVLKAVRVQYN